MRGRSLAEVELAAIRSSYERNAGDRTKMMAELQRSRMTLLRKLTKLGLRHPRKPRHLREADLARAFQRHRKLIAVELGISDSTLANWLNKRAPFAAEEG